LHANVKILDRNLERLRQVDIHFDGRVQTIASSELTRWLWSTARS